MKRFALYFNIVVYLLNVEYLLCKDLKTLKVLSFKDSHSKALLKLIDTFEQQHHVKVILNQVPSSMVMTKIFTDQMAGGSYDVYTIDEPFIASSSAFLTDFASWPEVSHQNLYDFHRTYVPSSIQSVTYNNKIYGLPIHGNVYFYQYRKDLFEDPKEIENFYHEYGYPLAVPQNMKQFRDIAKFFHRPPAMYGFAPFTKKSEGTTVEALWILKTFGVELYSPSGIVKFDIDRARKAFQFYMELLKYSPPGSRSWHHAERNSTYCKGKISQMLNWPGFAFMFENHQKSKVVGLTKYDIPPASEYSLPSPFAGLWFLAIPKSSKEKKLASQFIHWWSSYKVGLTLSEHGMNPTRKDLLNKAISLRPHMHFKAMIKSFNIAQIRPQIIEYKKFSDMISYYFTSMIIEKISVDEAVNRIAENLKIFTPPNKLVGYKDHE